jgi:hypothetical protein
MGVLIEVKYFNNFLIRKTDKMNGAIITPSWNGSFGIPEAIGGYPVIEESDKGPDNWVIEESRIRGGYNNTSTDLGVRAYLVEEEPNAVIRGNSLIYSGIFNSRTGVNNTNVFSVGEEIIKSADPANGSIQRLYAEDTNLIVFQEAKVSRALIDKDAIYTAEGGGSITNTNTTIGTIQPYAGEFGISKDPGSFAVYGYRKYFTDRNRNAVLRLSMDGLTQVSEYGMSDYFRDELNNINSVGIKGVITGGWDVHNKQYVLNTSQNPVINNPVYNTLTFDEKVLGWTSFFTYNPDQLFSLENNFYSLKNGSLYRHYATTTVLNVAVPRGTFYGVTTKSSVSFIFNPNVSTSKIFQTVNYEGSNGWQVDSFNSDQTGKDFSTNSTWVFTEDVTTTEPNPVPSSQSPSVWSYVQGAYDSLGLTGLSAITPPIHRAGFDRKENKYFANLVNSSVANQGEVLWGNSISGIKGYFATVTLSTDNVTDPGGLKELFAVSSNFKESSY